MSRDPWGAWWVRRTYSREGYANGGEQAAFDAIADRLRGADVLDLGIGGGRTTTLLEPTAGSYVGVDLSEGMVALARRRHPDTDVRRGDARHLAGVDDASRDIVVFSLNGIDAVGHEDRPRVLAEVARVLRPGGLFVFSTFNLDGVTRRERPDLTTLTEPTDQPRLLAPVVFAKRMVDTVMSMWNERRTRALNQEGEDWAVAPLRAHEFRFAIHFIRLRAAVAELRAHGLEPEAAWKPGGEPIPLAADRSEANYMMFVARKRDA